MSPYILLNLYAYVTVGRFCRSAIPVPILALRKILKKITRERGNFLSNRDMYSKRGPPLNTKTSLITAVYGSPASWSTVCLSICIDARVSWVEYLQSIVERKGDTAFSHRFSPSRHDSICNQWTTLLVILLSAVYKIVVTRTIEMKASRSYPMFKSYESRFGGVTLFPSSDRFNSSSQFFTNDTNGVFPNRLKFYLHSFH